MRLAQIANEAKNLKGSDDDAKKDGDVSATPLVETAPAVQGGADQLQLSNDDLVNGVPILSEEAETTPAAPTITEEVIVDDEDTTAAAIAEEEAAQAFEFDISWMTDPMLNLSIVLLAVICYLLIRKTTALVAELQTLNHSLTTRY